MNAPLQSCLSREFLKRNIYNGYVKLIVHYSRKRNATGANGPYKVVKADDTSDDSGNLNMVNNSNWELFATHGYPFYMPGSVGPAWQNTETSESFKQLSSIIDTFDASKFSDKKLESLQDKECHCMVQDCPMVLRKGVSELFAGRDLKNTSLTVVTLIQRSDIKEMRTNREGETEKLAKSFVLAAQDICMTLTVMGYWADFINPFSGKPYLSPFHNSTLYDTDERFRCLDFQIVHQHNCKIISNESASRTPKTFIGSLFTTAPSNTNYLQEIKTYLL